MRLTRADTGPRERPDTAHSRPGRDHQLTDRSGATIEAPLVFAGHGLQIPEAHHDDFAGLDVRGKLVVILSGAPMSIPGPLASHMQSAAERAALLSAWAPSAS